MIIVFFRDFLLIEKIDSQEDICTTTCVDSSKENQAAQEFFQSP